jgi:putative tryptophan/tyrosine transport system substrate-binding protein
MRRREFIAGLGSAAVAWPLAARAQQGDRVRRVGVLMGWSESDPVFRGWGVTFAEELARLGWVDGRNARIEQRWTDANVDRAGMFAKELVDLQPDVILAGTTPVTAALQRETRVIPIIFAGISDPVGAGFVASLSRPGGNLTGFINLEAAIHVQSRHCARRRIVLSALIRDGCPITQDRARLTARAQRC